MEWFVSFYQSWTCIWIGVALIVILLVVFFVVRNMRRDED